MRFVTHQPKFAIYKSLSPFFQPDELITNNNRKRRKYYLFKDLNTSSLCLFLNA